MYAEKTHAYLTGKFIRLYGVSLKLVGPIMFSGSSLVASAIVQKTSSAFDFGIFAFIQVVLASGMRLLNGFITVPSMNEIANKSPINEVLQSFVPAGLAFCLIGSLSIYPVIIWSGGSSFVAILSSLLAFFTWSRYMYRSLALIVSSGRIAVISDTAYGVINILLLTSMLFFHKVDVKAALLTQIVSSVVSAITLAKATGFIYRIEKNRIKFFFNSFKVTGISSLIVALSSQISTSAHAYVTTLWLSPAAFAPIALATLAYRPHGVILTGIMQYESPQVAKAIRSNDKNKAVKVLKDLYFLVILAWLGNSLVSFFVGYSGNSFLNLKEYSISDVRLALVFIGVLVLLRAATEPQTAFLQITGQSTKLAKLSILCAIITIIMIVISLTVLGKSPVYTLLGPLFGELVNLLVVSRLSRGSFWNKSEK